MKPRPQLSIISLEFLDDVTFQKRFKNGSQELTVQSPFYHLCHKNYRPISLLSLVSQELPSNLPSITYVTRTNVQSPFYHLSQELPSNLPSITCVKRTTVQSPFYHLCPKNYRPIYLLSLVSQELTVQSTSYHLCPKNYRPISLLSLVSQVLERERE